MSVLDQQVSYFNKCSQSDTPNRTANLRRLLATDYFAQQVAEVRAIADKDERKLAKATMPAFTPSCVCSERNTSHVLQHSGLIAFDIDLKDNTHIANYHELREQLSKIVHVAYCGLSVSGTGVWGLVPITNTDRHKDHFAALAEDFARFDIVIDSAPSSVVSLRIVSHDSQGYFNDNAVPYERLYQRKKVKPIRLTYANNDDIGETLAYIATNGIDLTSSYQHWMNLAFAFASEYNEGGRDYFHLVSSQHPKYDTTATDKKFDNALKTGTGSVTIASFYALCKENGVPLGKKKTSQIPIGHLPTKPTKPFMVSNSEVVIQCQHSPFALQSVFVNRWGKACVNQLNEHGYPASWDN